MIRTGDMNLIYDGKVVLNSFGYIDKAVSERDMSDARIDFAEREQT